MKNASLINSHHVMTHMSGRLDSYHENDMNTSTDVCLPLAHRKWYRVSFSSRKCVCIYIYHLHGLNQLASGCKITPNSAVVYIRKVQAYEKIYFNEPLAISIGIYLRIWYNGHQTVRGWARWLRPCYQQSDISYRLLVGIIIEATG